MKKETESINRDRCLYLLTEGEYDDYFIRGLFSGPRGLKVSELLAEWRASRELTAWRKLRDAYVETGTSNPGTESMAFEQWIEKHHGMLRWKYEELRLDI